jgi:hypothetical protein
MHRYKSERAVGDSFNISGIPLSRRANSAAIFSRQSWDRASAAT